MFLFKECSLSQMLFFSVFFPRIVTDRKMGIIVITRYEAR